jgi:hypothetical protein
LLYSIRLPFPPPIASCGPTRDHKMKLGSFMLVSSLEVQGRQGPRDRREDQQVRLGGAQGTSCKPSGIKQYFIMKESVQTSIHPNDRHSNILLSGPSIAWLPPSFSLLVWVAWTYDVRDLEGTSHMDTTGCPPCRIANESPSLSHSSASMGDTALSAISSTRPPWRSMMCTMPAWRGKGKGERDADWWETGFGRGNDRPHSRQHGKQGMYVGCWDHGFPT